MEVPASWTLVDSREPLSWPGDDRGTGLDPRGFEDSTWVLHPLEDDHDPGHRSWASASAARGYTSVARTHPPSHAWWPQDSEVWAWEGSLENPAYGALLDVLLEHSGRGEHTPCFAYYALVPTIFRLRKPAESDKPDDVLLQGELGELRSLPEAFRASNGHDHALSPNNFWPEDRSWIVYTDYDLWATKVSGPAALVSAIRSHPVLETLDWRRVGS